VSGRRPQRGFLFTALLMPIVVAMLAWPLVAHLTTLKAKQKALDYEVKLMLAPKGKRVPVPDIAAQAQAEAEAEVLSTIRF